MILDEIRSKVLRTIGYDNLLALEDVEAILAEMKCENCGHNQECGGETFWLAGNTLATKPIAFCSRFEKEKK